MARTFPTAGIAPIDAYVVDPGNRNAGYFVARQEAASANAYVTAVLARVEIDNTVTGAVGLQVTASIEDGASIANLYGIWIEMPTLNASATVDSQYAMSIRMKGDAISTYQHLFRLYNSATGATPAIDSVFHLANSGGSPFNLLFDFEGGVLPVSAYTSGTTVGYRVACAVGDTTYYLHLYTT